MEHTEYYHLPQWEETDRIQMDDFNDMTATLDAALKANADTMPRILHGSYTGNGNGSRTITLGCTPKAVLIMKGGYGTYNNSTVQGGLIVASEGNDVGSIVSNGFRVPYAENSTNIVYYYVAFC